MSGGESINVFVRVRPPLESEILAADSSEVVDVLGKKDVSVGGVRSSYDMVFPGTATQEDVYEAIKPSVEAVATGVNCTIFAYGQTGSGKTHTMLGTNLEDSLLADEDFAPSHNWGIIPRAVDDLFLLLAEHAAEGTTAMVHCAYMQIYNDKIYDLLQDRKRRRPLAIREIHKSKKRREVYVQNLAEYRVSSAEDVLMLLQQGGHNRAVRGTELNEASSRSHALLQVSVEVESAQEGGSTVLRRAKLNMVDLAGSEKWNTKLSLGARRAKELTHINQSLSALGNCIAALTEKNRSHVPFRDSKLTRLLQDSLGGNTRTTVIATLGPMLEHKDESVSTLMFADRASRVVTRVRRNEVVDDAVLLARAQREISRLRELLTNNELAQQVDELTKAVQLLTAENKKLKAQMRHQSHYSFRSTGGGGDTAISTATSNDGGGDGAGADDAAATLPQVKGAISIATGTGAGAGAGAGGSTEPATVLSPQAPRPRGSKSPQRVLFKKSQTPSAMQQQMAAAYSPRGGSSRGSSAGGPRRAASKGKMKGRRVGSATKSLKAKKSAKDVRGRPKSQFSRGSEEDVPDEDVIEKLRIALQSEGSGAKTVMKLAADAEEQCGRELEGLLNSVDTIAAERKLLEQQLASLQDGLMRETSDYLEEGRKQRLSRRNSSNNNRKRNRRTPKAARPVSPVQTSQYPASVPTTPGLQGPARGFTFGKSDVGATISVYSSRYDEWSEGRVMAYDPIRKMHLVVYATGDRKWHMLKKDKKFKVLVASPSAKSKKDADVPSMSLMNSKRRIKLKRRPKLDSSIRTGLLDRATSPVNTT